MYKNSNISLFYINLETEINYIKKFWKFYISPILFQYFFS
jgi:hypothetical protein